MPEYKSTKKYRNEGGGRGMLCMICFCFFPQRPYKCQLMKSPYHRTDAASVCIIPSSTFEMFLFILPFSAWLYILLSSFVSRPHCPSTPSFSSSSFPLITEASEKKKWCVEITCVCAQKTIVCIRIHFFFFFKSLDRLLRTCNLHPDAFSPCNHSELKKKNCHCCFLRWITSPPTRTCVRPQHFVVSQSWSHPLIPGVDEKKAFASIHLQPMQESHQAPSIRLTELFEHKMLCVTFKWKMEVHQ